MDLNVETIRTNSFSKWETWALRGFGDLAIRAFSFQGAEEHR